MAELEEPTACGMLYQMKEEIRVQLDRRDRLEMNA